MAQLRDVESEVAAFPTIEHMPEDDTEPPIRDRRPLMFALVAWICALGWLFAVGVSNANALNANLPLATVVSMVRDAAPPLILIVVLYLLAVRDVRSQGARFARLSEALRAEYNRLERALVAASDRVDAEKTAVGDQIDRLMSVGEGAATRLHAIADKLKADLDGASGDAHSLHQSALGARGELSALLSDIPRARALTLDLTTALDAAGLSAYERAGALDAQVAVLVARGREADEIAGSAAQKLAAHLARVEGTSSTAGAHLVQAAETMTAAIDAALGRAADAGDAARRGMEAQGAAMRALVEQGEAALSKTGADAAEAVALRVADVTERLHALGALLDNHAATSGKTIDHIGEGIDRIDERFAAIDQTADARNDRLAATLAALATHATTLAGSLDSGAASAETMIGRTETLLTALDAASRDIGETLPAALTTFDSHADASRAKVAELGPEVARITREASSALDRLLEAEAALAKQHAALDELAAHVDSRLSASKTAAGELVETVEQADRKTREIADGAGVTLVEAMVRVRETAQAAADRARDALGAIVPETADRMSAAVKAALSERIRGEVEGHIAELATTADRAVAAASDASDRLMRQMLTIAETSAQVEARIASAHTEIDEADRDSFARRVALLIESLNSTAIDVTKILSNDVTDSAWSAYLKGDRGIFTRRAVRLLDAGEVREIGRHYNEEPEFREQVNRYIHDFEAMLRNVLATRAGSPLGVTLLSSDMGKLYVALAQAIERLRN